MMESVLNEEVQTHDRDASVHTVIHVFKSIACWRMIRFWQLEMAEHFASLIKRLRPAKPIVISIPNREWKTGKMVDRG